MGIDTEMVERLATVFQGGSFANKYQKEWTVKNLIKVLFAMTKEDCAKIMYEIQK